MLASDVCHQRDYWEGDEESSKCLKSLTYYHYCYRDCFRYHRHCDLYQKIPALDTSLCTRCRFCDEICRLEIWATTYNWVQIKTFWHRLGNFRKILSRYLLNRLTPLGLNKCLRHIVTTTNWKILLLINFDICIIFTVQAATTNFCLTKN